MQPGNSVPEDMENYSFVVRQLFYNAYPNCRTRQGADGVYRNGANRIINVVQEDYRTFLVSTEIQRMYIEPEKFQLRFQHNRVVNEVGVQHTERVFQQISSRGFYCEVVNPNLRLDYPADKITFLNEIISNPQGNGALFMHITDAEREYTNFEETIITYHRHFICETISESNLYRLTTKFEVPKLSVALPAALREPLFKDTLKF